MDEQLRHNFSQENPDLEALLEDLNKYLLDLARKNIPRSIVPPEVLDLEIDEIVQRSLIKLWQALTRRGIRNIKAYARCVVQTECIDMMRRHKKLLPLPINEDGEIYQGEIMISLSQGMLNPADEFEQAEALTQSTTKVIEDVLTLPPRQQYSMICTLKDQIEDPDLIIEIFLDHGLNITTATWPEGMIEMQRLRSLRSLAQKKLRSLSKKEQSHEFQA